MKGPQGEIRLVFLQAQRGPVSTTQNDLCFSSCTAQIMTLKTQGTGQKQLFQEEMCFLPTW